MNETKDKWARVIIIGILMFIAALLILGYCLFDSCRIRHNTRLASEEYQELISYEAIEPEKKEIVPETEAPASEEPADIQSVIPDDGNSYIGMISIPALDLNLPVLSECTEAKLYIAPCRYEGSAEEKNLIICAHNYKSHFARLKTLSVDSDVYFTDISGNEFRYKVAKTERVKGEAIEYMKAGEWDLTLFTCTIGGASRETVRCVLQPKHF